MAAPELFFEWEVVEGPFKGKLAALLSQPPPDQQLNHTHLFVDIKFRDRDLVRGPFTVYFDWLRWKGPHGK